MDRTTRRRYLLTAGTACVTAVAGCSSGDPEPAGESDTDTPAGETTADPDGWRMFAADAANSGTAAVTGPTDDATEQWAFGTDGEAGAAVVADGTVVVGSGDTVTALSASDGTERWRFETGEAAAQSGSVGGPAPAARLSAADGGQTDLQTVSSGRPPVPAVVDDTAYVVGGEGALYALAVADGRERWRFQLTDAGAPDTDGDSGAAALAGPPQSRLQVGTTGGSAPTVHDGVVYVQHGDGTVYAVDSAGTEQWRTRTGGRASVTLPGGATGVGRRNRYALAGPDGVGQVAQPVAGGAVAPPAVVDGVVYVAGVDGTVAALAAADGDERWAFTPAETMAGRADPAALQEAPASVSAPAVVGDTVYVGRDDAVYALATADGSERWRFRTGGAVTASPAVVGDTVYVGSGDDAVYALATTDGSERWRFETGGAVDSSPAVVGDTVYVGSGDAVYALAAADGSERWRFRTGVAGGSAPAVADGRVYVGRGDTVYALAEPGD